MKTFSARETAWLQELDGLELAGFRHRAVAFLIDWAIVGVLISLALSLGTLAWIGIAKATGHAAGFDLDTGFVHVGNPSAPAPTPQPTAPPSAVPPPAPPAADTSTPSSAEAPEKHRHVQVTRWHMDDRAYHKLAEEALKIFTDILVPCLYFGLFLWRWNGQTPGKRAMKIRVVSLVHRRMSFWHSVERALGYGAATLEAGFGFFQFWLHPYRRCAQDRLAETIVVMERSYAEQLRSKVPGVVTSPQVR